MVRGLVVCKKSIILCVDITYNNMRVLWFTPSSGLYSPTSYGTWVEALQYAVKEYGKDLEVGVCFEYGATNEKQVKDGFTYYPISIRTSMKNKLKIVSSPWNEYNLLKPHYLKAIHDFKPDIIQCFGTELWHYSLLAKEVDIPMVVHIMGFQNIYHDVGNMVTHKSDIYRDNHYNPFSIFRYAVFREKKNRIRCQMELEEMRVNHYFMGRTEWDKNIVKYLSLGSKYYYCAEAIRPKIYNSERLWSLPNHNHLRLITIGSGSGLKGNEIILKTAYILKNILNVDFEWRVTTIASAIRPYEKIVSIRHEDVNVNLIGRVDADDIIDELTNADMYIHPAIIDNSPNTVCEAQLLGTPVIATNVGGIPQLVENGKTGILYPYNESYTLAFSILNLYQNNQKMEELSKKEYEISHERHNPKKIVNTLQNIYKDILIDYKELKK